MPLPCAPLRPSHSARLSAALLVFVSCGASQRAPVVAPAPEPATWRGTITFATRSPTPTGASQAFGRKPARFVTVAARDADGEIISATRTDERGAFVLASHRGARSLLVLAQIEHPTAQLAVVQDAAGEQPHRHEVALEDPAAAVALHVADDLPMCGALHILDTLYKGSRAVRRWLGRPLPPFYAYWGRGITTEWSFYTGQRALAGRHSIELLGGEPGRQYTTDTDEHDEAIVLHEFGHFVMDVLSSDSSHGGNHPRGVLINPGLAWEEGRATWFATAVLGAPHYLDTIGIEPTGSLRINHDLERQLPAEPRGIGSEASVAEVLWDLADGAEGLADVDRDGVALGPSAVLESMIELGERPGAHPALPAFLRFLVESGRVGEIELKQMLEVGRQPASLYPGAASEVWPRDLPVPGRHAGKLDGLSDPAPSGGPPRPSNGVDALAVYRVHLERPGRLRAVLRIFGSGRPDDHQDLDLELRDIRSQLLDRSAGVGARESVSRRVEAGWYILYVRDGGGGNKVGYELDVALR